MYVIIDWVKNSQEIQKTKKLRLDEPCDRKVAFKQEIVFVQYLLDTCGYSREKCFKTWLRIENGTAAKFEGDAEAQKIEFAIIWRKIANDQYRKSFYTTHVQPIQIFKEEIDFLNSLDAPLWMKQYWGALLFYYKFASQIYDRVSKTSTLNAWCIQHSSYKKKNYGGKCQDLIAHKALELRKRGVEIIQDSAMERISERYPTFVPLFSVKTGTAPAGFNDTADIDKFLSLIHVSQVQCPECGGFFELSSYKKTPLCPECYKKLRRDQWRAAKQKARQRAI